MPKLKNFHDISLTLPQLPDSERIAWTNCMDWFPNIFLKIFLGKQVSHSDFVNAVELWFCLDILSTTPTNYFPLSWVPSHLQVS